MSEPVSNAEIEDVLSSIRRLVSGEIDASSANENKENEKPVPVTKLILTPDFRVSGPKDTDGKSGESAEGDSVGDSGALIFRHASGGGETEPALKIGNEPKPVQDDAQVSSLESTIAELEAAIGQQDGEWEPDGSEFEEDADAEAALSGPVLDLHAETAGIPAVKEDVLILEEVAEAEDAKVILEPANPELVGFPAEEIAAKAVDHAIEDVVEDAGSKVENPADNLRTVDQDALRDLVGTIVRQELQGALGERITRNVRKLVRREINRVLAAQDFD